MYIYTSYYDYYHSDSSQRTYFSRENVAKIIWKEKEEKESGSMIREHINKNIIKRNFNYKN